MWKLKLTIIPVMTGATGIITRSLRKNLEVVPGKHYYNYHYYHHYHYHQQHLLYAGYL